MAGYWAFIGQVLFLDFYGSGRSRGRQKKKKKKKKNWPELINFIEQVCNFLLAVPCTSL